MTLSLKCPNCGGRMTGGEMQTLAGRVHRTVVTCKTPNCDGALSVSVEAATPASPNYNRMPFDPRRGAHPL